MNQQLIVQIATYIGQAINVRVAAIRVCALDDLGR
jgi:hypothetical protein